MNLPGKSGSVDVEATVDRENLRLLELAAWKADGQRTGAPLAEMVLVALNVAIADEQFTVSKSLAEDGRIGPSPMHRALLSCGRSSPDAGRPSVAKP